jgi:predicted metal-binding protein
MDKEKILNEYANIGVSSARGLYNFLCDNYTACILGKKYNLKRGNEVMEFMALFLESLNYDVKRLVFEKRKKMSKISTKKNCHFMVAFSDDNKWYYYDALVGDISGMYVFNDYDSLIGAIYSNLIKYFNCLDCSGNSLMREIKPLEDFNVNNNINNSSSGMEIMTNYDEKFIPLSKFMDYDGDNFKIKRRRKKERGPFYLFFGFIGTLLLMFALCWGFFAFVLKH